MNILMLGWELPPHNSGGLGVACYYMSKAIALQGASIDFVVPYDAHHPSTDFMKVHSATRHKPLNQTQNLGAYAPGGDVSLRSLQDSYISFVEEFVADHTPDAIHAHDWLTMEAGMKAKELTDAPLIVHVHATEYDRSGSHYGNKMVHDIEQEGLLMADRIIAVSELTKSIIIQKYGIPSDKIEVVYNAFDIDQLEPHSYDVRTYHYLEALKLEGYTVVAALTRLTVQKGLTHFMQAAAKASQKHPKLVFLLAGSGEQRDELIRLSADLGIADKVFFTGFVRGKQWRDAYNVADIFVMSSVSEPFGITALEAAHHDTTLVITHQSGVSEILHSAMKYDFWDVDALADRLIGIASSPALSRLLRENASHEYARISWHDVAVECLKLYEQTRKQAVAA